MDGKKEELHSGLKHKYAQGPKTIVRKLYVIFFAIWCASPAFTQATVVDAYSSSQLAHLAQKLHAQANAADGTASMVLAKYPGHFTMLVYRNKDGEVEVHQRYADIILVIDGEAIMITGGTTRNGKETKPGEIRGTSIAGGTQSKLEKNELIHIPANTPHQILVPAGNSITYIAIKVETAS